MALFHQKRKIRGPISAMRVAWTQAWRTMLAGLLVWIPLIITVWVSWLVLNKFVLGIERQHQNLINLLHELGREYASLSFLQQIPLLRGFGIFLAIALFVFTGLLTRHFVGQRIIALGERIVTVIPLVNRIYRAVQQIRDVFVGRQGAVFQKVCLIDYPRKGMAAVAFVTSTEQGIVQDVLGRELQAVFVPTTPNPTSGYLVYLPPEDITELDISVEDAMKLIISAGAYHPRNGRVAHLDEDLDMTPGIEVTEK